MNHFANELHMIIAKYDAARKQRDALVNELRSGIVILYGAGSLSSFLLDRLCAQNINVECFCDTYRCGVHASGLPIITPEALEESFPDARIVIASDLHSLPIASTLNEVGHRGRIFKFVDVLNLFSCSLRELVPHFEGYEWVYNVFSDSISKEVVLESIRTRLLGVPMSPSRFSQYFEMNVCPLTGSEVFVDCGCFIGDTIEELIRLTNGSYSHIYGFEPDKTSFEKALLNLAKYKRITVANCGIWNTADTVRFSSKGSSISKFSEDGDAAVITVRLDEFFADRQKPTFIKMDIEGAELNAIDGASEIIRSCNPKLAICVYHHVADMYLIPQRILQLNPKYTMKLRHYSNWYAETVCYAN